MPNNPRAWLPAYLALAAIWGCSFYFMKLGLESLTPAGVAFGRIVLGLLTLLIFSAATKTKLAPRSVWKPLFLTALLVATVPWLAFAFGETHISSALAGIINGATPLLTLIATLLVFSEERPTPRRMVGLGIGFIGVLVVVGIWQGLGSGTWIGIAACVIAITCYGFSYPYMRRHLTGGPNASTLSPLALATGLLIMATIQITPIAVVTGFTVSSIVAPTVFGMLALGCLGSGVAYVLNFRVINKSDATTASTVTYLTPLVAIIAGALFLAEPISWNQPVGGLLIVLGAAIAQGLIKPRARSPQPRPGC